MESVEQLDEYLLDELQFRVYQLMKEKYYPEFKQCVEFNKLITKNEFMKHFLNTFADDDYVSARKTDTGSVRLAILCHQPNPNSIKF
jgi:hypothetical protein